MSRRLRSWAVVAMVLPVTYLTIGAWNYLEIERPLSKVAAADPRNAGVEMHGHFFRYVDPQRLVLNIEGVHDTAAPVDVFRLLLQVSAALRNRSFERVELTFRGHSKFYLRGEYFHEIGEEYGRQNPVYTMRTFPQHLYLPDGTSAYSSWSGGWLGVLGHQMDDFADFHRKWYIDDLSRSGMSPHDGVLASEPVPSSPSVQQVQTETETSGTGASGTDFPAETKTAAAQAAPAEETSILPKGAAADSGAHVLTFVDQVRAVHEAPKFYLDDIAHTYHTPDCPAVRPKEMPLVIKAFVTLKGYPPHDCVAKQMPQAQR